MTLDELQAKLPPEMAPWVAEYGPRVLALGVDVIKDYIERLILGDVSGVYKDLVGGMVAAGDVAAVAAERRRALLEGALLNKANAETMQLLRTAGAVMGKILLTLLLAAVGF